MRAADQAVRRHMLWLQPSRGLGYMLVEEYPSNNTLLTFRDAWDLNKYGKCPNVFLLLENAECQDPRAAICCPCARVGLFAPPSSCWPKLACEAVYGTAVEIRSTF